MILIVMVDLIAILVSFSFLVAYNASILSFVESYGQNEEVYSAIGRVATDKMKYAHRYHGIAYSEFVNQEYVFYRDGKICPLFTQGMLESWERNNGRNDN